MQLLRLKCLLVTLALTCRVEFQFGQAGEGDKQEKSKENGGQEDKSVEDTSTSSTDSDRAQRPTWQASKLRRIKKKANGKVKHTRTKRASAGRLGSGTLRTVPRDPSPRSAERNAQNSDEKTDATAATVGTTGSVALLFLTGAALKNHILGGATPGHDAEASLPGALSEIPLYSPPESPSTGLYDLSSPGGFSYGKAHSPRSILSQVAFPGEDASSPTTPAVPQQDLTVASKPQWVAAGVAGLLALFSVAGVFWANKEIKKGGLLSEGLAAWDAYSCVMFVDVQGAHKSKRLHGEFVRRSAQVSLNASQKTGVIRYLEKPRFLSNMVSKLIRRTLTRTELFPIPRDRCFAAVSIVSESGETSIAESEKKAVEKPSKRDLRDQKERRAVIRSAFVREVVDPKTGITAGILVHLDRCPGWRRGHLRNRLLLNPDDFFQKLSPSTGLSGCPRIEQKFDGRQPAWKAANNKTLVKNYSAVGNNAVESSLITSIVSDSRLLILACNMEVLAGPLRIYLLVAVSPGRTIKVHYALGTRQLLIDPRGPSPMDTTPCLTDTESAEPVLENNIPKYAIITLKNLQSALENVQPVIGNQFVTALKDVVVPPTTRIFGVVVEMRQERLKTIPRKLPLRKADEMALRDTVDRTSLHAPYAPERQRTAARVRRAAGQRRAIKTKVDEKDIANKR